MVMRRKKVLSYQSGKKNQKKSHQGGEKNNFVAGGVTNKNNRHRPQLPSAPPDIKWCVPKCFTVILLRTIEVTI